MRVCEEKESQLQLVRSKLGAIRVMEETIKTKLAEIEGAVLIIRRTLRTSDGEYKEAKRALEKLGVDKY